jgi:hypothetical protein
MGLVVWKGEKVERSEWANFHPNAADFYGYMNDLAKSSVGRFCRGGGAEEEETK